MPVTFYCSQCNLHWSPFQTSQGTCQRCGGGTQRRTDSEPDADVAFEVVKADRQIALLHKKFEDYYQQRERERNEKQD